MKEGEPYIENEGYDIPALRLAEFVNHYIPPHWRESLQSVMPPFSFSSEEVEHMETHFKQGDLKETLKKKYNNENVGDAIYSFFEDNT